MTLPSTTKLFALAFVLLACIPCCLAKPKTCATGDDYVYSGQFNPDVITEEFQGCRNFTGKSLLIMSNEAGVNALTAASDVYVQSETMTNFNTLTSVEVIYEDLIIKSNTLLESVDGLQNLHTIHGSLTIESNPVLRSLSGFRNLKVIEGDLRIQFNSALLDFIGFQALKRVNGEFHVHTNANLASLASSAMEHAAYVQVWNNDHLATFCFRNFRGTDHGSFVYGNHNLNELCFLPGPQNNIEDNGENLVITNTPDSKDPVDFPTKDRDDKAAEGEESGAATMSVTAATFSASAVALALSFI